MIERIIRLAPLPERPEEGHKGLFGRVLVVGGCDSMIGAPALAGTSALRMGAGLVQIATPKSILHHCLSITPELIGLPLDVRLTGLTLAAKDSQAIVVGPGMGQSAQANRIVQSLILIDRRMVLDADALNLMAKGKNWPRRFNAQTVLTPHPGEMNRLSRLLGKAKAIPEDDAGRIDLAVNSASQFGQVIVLKGHRTIVTDGKRVYLNRTGNSALSKAGTGDVLSGMIGTLLAQKMDRFDAACAAVWIHGRAGELAGSRLGLRSPLARDVIDALPAAIGEYESRH